MIRAASTAATRGSVKFVSHYMVHVHVCRVVQVVGLFLFFCGQECAWRCLIDVQQRSPLVYTTVRWVLLKPSIACLYWRTGVGPSIQLLFS